MREMLQIVLLVVGYQKKKLEKVKRHFTMLCTEPVRNNEFTAYNLNEMRL